MRNDSVSGTVLNAGNRSSGLLSDDTILVRQDSLVRQAFFGPALLLDINP
jgi:hypothetical protein